MDNIIIYKSLFGKDTFMPEIHLKQHGFTYSTCRRKHFYSAYRNELDKTCFQHELIYVDFTDWPRRTTYEKALHKKLFVIASNVMDSMMDINADWRQYSGTEITENQELTIELHKPITGIFQRREKYSWNLFNTQWNKTCWCWKIYQTFEE